MRNVAALIAAVLLFCGAGKPALAFSTANARVIDAIARHALKVYGAPGLSIAIVEHGRVVYARGYGYADKARGKRASARTQYQIGSVTKQFIAAEILALQSKGLLNLHWTLNRFWGAGPDGRVTIAELLDQRSGIPDFNTPRTLLPQAASILEGRISPEHFASAVMRRPPNFAPGSKFQYSNSNYLLLGLIVELVTRQPLGARLKSDFFEPLGMADTVLGPARHCQGSSACAYSKTPLGVRSITPWDWRLTFSAGGMTSTAVDLARWDIALMKSRVGDRGTLQDMLIPRSRNGYGYAEYVYAAPHDDTVAWHDGTVYGFKAMNSLVLPGDDAVVVLANADYAHAPIVAMKIENALWGIPGGSGERADLNLPRYAYWIGALSALAVLLALLPLRRAPATAIIVACAAYVASVYVWFLGPAIAVSGVSLQLLAARIRR